MSTNNLLLLCVDNQTASDRAADQPSKSETDKLKEKQQSKLKMKEFDYFNW